MSEKTKTLSDYVALLRRHNEWRRCNDIDPPPMEPPALIGEAIDAVCDAVEHLDAIDEAIREEARGGGDE